LTVGGRLHGKVVVVTGGGSGVGKETALLFASEGAKVYILGRTLESLNEVKSTQEKKGSCFGAIVALQCDVSDSSSVSKTFTEIIKTENKLNILINSAGFNIPKRKIAELSIEDWQSIQNTNVNGAFYCIHSSLDQMRKQQDGLIINVSSVAALRGLPLAGTAYCASKAAMSIMGSTIASEEYINNIRICNFCPGEINTPIIDKREVVPSEEDRMKMLQASDCAQALLMVALLPSRAQVSELVIKPTVQQFWL